MEHTLWYQSPAAVWNEALPLGNGTLGAMIYGGTTVDRYQLNEDTVWSGGPQNRVNPDAKRYLPEIRRLLREDHIEEAQQLSEVALSGLPDEQRHYEPLGGRCGVGGAPRGDHDPERAAQQKKSGSG